MRQTDTQRKPNRQGEKEEEGQREGGGGRGEQT